MKSFCFIPAKAASKRLKKKNILKLNGKELIYYPIKIALDSGIFQPEDVILSTESEEIKAIAEQHGASVPYLREAYLSLDPYQVTHVLLDFLEKFPAYQAYDTACMILPTAPLMRKEDVLNCFELYQKNDFNVVMSVTKTEHNALRSIFVRNGQVTPLDDHAITKGSTELEQTYRINGAVVVVNVSEFYRQQSCFLKPWGAYEMPPLNSIDIDNKEDFEYAQFLMSKQL